mgnify:CR=1 FL=1
MCTITATEFKTNFGKYLKLGQTEPIQVTSRGKVVFETVPPKEALARRAEKLIGILPKDTPIDMWKNREL